MPFFRRKNFPENLTTALVLSFAVNLAETYVSSNDRGEGNDTPYIVSNVLMLRLYHHEQRYCNEVGPSRCHQFASL